MKNHDKSFNAPRREHLANHLSIIAMHHNGAHWHYYATFIDPHGRCGYQLSNTLVQCAGAMSLNRAIIYRLVIAGRQAVCIPLSHRVLAPFCRVKKRVVPSFFIFFYRSHACSVWHHILFNSFLLLSLRRKSE